MITAKEAKNLYDQSGSEVQEYLERFIEHKIIKAAESGKREYIDHLDAEEISKVPNILSLHKAVVLELIRLGYSAEIVSYGDQYVPAGLRDDYDGSGPMYQNYGIEIKW